MGCRGKDANRTLEQAGEGVKASGCPDFAERAPSVGRDPQGGDCWSSTTGRRSAIPGVHECDGGGVGGVGPTPLPASGIANGGPEPGGGAPLLRLADPDGNRVVRVGR